MYAALANAIATATATTARRPPPTSHGLYLAGGVTVEGGGICPDWSATVPEVCAVWVELDGPCGGETFIADAIDIDDDAAGTRREPESRRSRLRSAPRSAAV